MPGVGHHLLCITTAGSQRADLLADFPLVDVRTDCADGAADFKAHIGRSTCRRRVSTSALQKIGAVYARVGHLDDNLVRAGCGGIDLDDANRRKGGFICWVGGIVGNDAHIYFQESFSVTVRLKIGAPGLLSFISATK